MSTLLCTKFRRSRRCLWREDERLLSRVKSTYGVLGLFYVKKDITIPSA